MTFIWRQSTDQQIVNHFYLTGRQLTQTNGHYAVQCQVTDFVTTSCY